jgi:hypothetical protein
MDEKENIIPDGVSPLRFMIAEAYGKPYRNFKNLVEARKGRNATLVMEGDYGGQIYLTCPVEKIKCGEKELKQLLEDIDAIEWGNPDGAGMYFEEIEKGSGVAGGMGGGIALEGLWVHERLKSIENKIEAVISGKIERIG